jgi:predicted nuclease of predicted toxin-antitoxin system
VFALVQALRQRRMDIVRVQDRGRSTLTMSIYRRALADGRVMLTNDTDFLV